VHLCHSLKRGGRMGKKARKFAPTFVEGRIKTLLSEG